LSGKTKMFADWASVAVGTPKLIVRPPWHAPSSIQNGIDVVDTLGLAVEVKRNMNIVSFRSKDGPIHGAMDGIFHVYVPAFALEIAIGAKFATGVTLEPLNINSVTDQLWSVSPVQLPSCTSAPPAPDIPRASRQYPSVLRTTKVLIPDAAIRQLTDVPPLQGTAPTRVPGSCFSPSQPKQWSSRAGPASLGFACRNKNWSCAPLYSMNHSSPTSLSPSHVRNSDAAF
jgi:hypothetical protein